MANNRILIATVLLVGLLGLTVWQFNARESEDTRAPDVTVKLPKLKKDDIDELRIAAPEKTAVVLKKSDKTWKVVEPLKAEADQQAVDNALSKLDELEVTGVAATKKENHADLDVDDKKAVHVTAKHGDKVLAELLIGTYRGGNTMVRQKDATLVATVKGSIKYAFDKAVKEWRDRKVVDVPSEQVKTAAYENPNGSLHFVQENKVWKQAPGEKPIPNFDAGKVTSFVGTAITLHANDFAPSNVTAETAGVGDKPDGLVTLTTGGDAGEQQIVLRVGHKTKDGYYVKRVDKDPIFIVSEWSGGRLIPSADKFSKEETKKSEADKSSAQAKAETKHAHKKRK